MNIVIVGLGNVGEHYFELLKNNRKIKNIYIIENNLIQRKNKNYEFINLKQVNNKFQKIML